jgi:hypothetical protein
VAAIINKIFQLSLVSGYLLFLNACSPPPTAVIVTPLPTPKDVTPKTYTTPTGVTIIPYDIEPIIRKPL